MKQIRFFIMFAIGLFVQSELWAQSTTWSLEQCIRYAWDNNISIKQQELTTGQAANSLQQSKLTFLPSVGARASYNIGWGLAETRVTDENGISTTIYVDNTSQNISPSIYASVNLFEGLQKFHNVNRNKADYNAAKQEVERLRNDISLQIARAYLQVLLAKEMLTTAESSRDNVDQQREQTRKMVEAGSKPYSTLLEIEAQWASENVQCVTARNQVDIAYLTLRQLLDIDPRAAFDLVTPTINIALAPQADSISGLYALAQDLPQIQVAEFRKESATYAHKAANSRFWPTLSFSASYGSGAYYSNLLPSENFWDQLSKNVSPGLGFGLSFPLFQNWTNVTNSKNTKLSLRIAELEVENRQKALYKEIQQAITDASAAYNKYNAGEQNVKAMQESFRYTQEKFDVGMVTATDFSVAKNNLFKAQSDMLQAKYQYVFQLKILDFYKGIPITL